MATSEELATYPPELLKQLYDAGQIDAKQARLALKLKEAQGVRSAKGPQGRYTGRTYVAANPLEHLVDALRKRKAGKNIGEMESQQEAMSQQQADARGEFRKGSDAALRGGMYQGNDVTTFGMPEQASMGQGQPIAAPPPPPQPVTQNPGSPGGPGMAPPIPMGQPGDAAGSFDPKYMPNAAGLKPDQMAMMQKWLQSQQGGMGQGQGQSQTAMYANALRR